VHSLIVAATLFLVSNASPPLAPFTTTHDDSCDIAVAPAATLLLPYFEVSTSQPRERATSTLVTVVNVSGQPRIARVTLWTDWAYPILTFNLTLGAYGVESLDLYDVLTKGTIARNHNGNCDAPLELPDSLRYEAVRALTSGLAAYCPNARVGGNHTNAIGYATIDLVANCGSASPADASFYKNDLLYDNVLIGDYQEIWTGMGDATGTPLVHVRAVPEGGAVGEAVATNLPFTFYDRYTQGQSTRSIDRRQPLPSAFAARYYQAADGETRFLLWREAITYGRGCAVVINSVVPMAEFIRFDQHENATATYIVQAPITPIAPSVPTTPTTSAQLTTNSVLFPPMTSSGDDSGWMYLNLNNGGSTSYSGARPGLTAAGTAGPRASQNWVVVRMANSRYAHMFDAAPLGNGCSSGVANGTTVGPIGGIPVCPSASITCASNPRYTGTNITP
jgi:hypothetical protein